MYSYIVDDTSLMCKNAFIFKSYFSNVGLSIVWSVYLNPYCKNCSLPPEWFSSSLIEWGEEKLESCYFPTRVITIMSILFHRIRFYETLPRNPIIKNLNWSIIQRTAFKLSGKKIIVPLLTTSISLLLDNKNKMMFRVCVYGRIRRRRV